MTAPKPVDELFDRVRLVVAEQLFPQAMATDQNSTFPGDNIRALASSGLFGMVVPTDSGGLGLTPSQGRAMLRLISSGCGATAFAFAQHHGATAAVAGTKNAYLRDQWLHRLVDHTLAGTAFAHVRRPGDPVLRAVADGDRWILDGAAPWVTSWGHAEVMTVAAKTDEGQLVWALLPAKEAPGLSVSKAFDLMVFQATQTVALAFDSVAVAPEAVLNVVGFDAWAQRDRALAARPSPLCIGIGDRALDELRSVAPAAAADIEPWWRDECDAAEAQARAVDEAIAAKAVDDALVSATAAARSRTLLAVQRLTTMLLSASGGSAVEVDRTAQRLAREALFYVIQAQSPDGKRATLEALNPARS